MKELGKSKGEQFLGEDDFHGTFRFVLFRLVPKEWKLFFLSSLIGPKQKHSIEKMFMS